MNIANDSDIEGHVFDEHRFRLENGNHCSDHHPEIIGFQWRLKGLVFDLYSGNKKTSLSAHHGLLAEEAAQQFHEFGLGRLIQLAGFDALRTLPLDGSRNGIESTQIVSPCLRLVGNYYIF